MVLAVKRIYESPAADDGFRVLVDRLWPRGLRKEAAEVALWLREAAPSDALRRWFHAHPDQWEAFRARYAAELDAREEVLAPLTERLGRGERVTLLFAARDTARNNAVALAQYLRAR